MANILTIISFVIIICLVNFLFIVFVLPTIIKWIDDLLKGEMFFSIFEFFFASFLIALITISTIYFIYSLM
jgi:hypothetical protein